MNKITASLGIIVMALCFCLGTTLQSKAQSKAASKGFAGVIPFSTTSDRIGFFDQSSGRIYVYDNNLSQCLFIGQLKALGQPIQAGQASGG